jgi:hypothetical protein
MRTRPLRNPALWLLGGIALASLAYVGVRGAADGPQAGRYRAETRWGDGSAGFHVVDVEVSRSGPGTYVEYRIQMDPPGRIAGCRGRAERTRSGQLEFRCNDGWNDVRGRFRASGGAALLQVEQLGTGGEGIGAFYGDHEVSRVDGTPGAR